MGKRGAGSTAEWRKGPSDVDDFNADVNDDANDAAPQQQLLELPIIVSCLFESTAAASINRRESARLR